jgi:hypothetical protein
MTDSFGRPERRDSADGGAPSEQREPAGAASSALVPLGLLVVLLGGIALAAGLFLPLAASPDSRVELIENRAIWYGGTDFVIGLALAAPFFAFLRWRGLPLPWWIASVLGVVGLLLALGAALVVDASTLADVDWAGPAAVESDDLAPGAGIWVAAAGALAIVLGGALLQAVGPPLRRREPVATAPEGWYPDPEGTELRWWDGTRWGDSRRPAAPGEFPPHDEATAPLGRFAPPVAPRALWRRPEGDPAADPVDPPQAG